MLSQKQDYKHTMKHLAYFIALVFLPASFCFAEQRTNLPANQSVLKQDIVGLWLMGQSLCEGAESVPIVTPTDRGWGNLMFQRGVRTWSYGKFCDKPQERPTEQFNFVPLTATKNGGLGETIANGLADHL